MGRLCKVLMCIFLGFIIIPITVNAAGGQLKLAELLTGEQKKSLVKQKNGLIKQGGKTTAREEVTPVTTVEAFDVELLSEPSPIETSMDKRLQSLSQLSSRPAELSSRPAELSSRPAELSSTPPELSKGDTLLNKAWGSKLGEKESRKVNLTDRKRLQTAWNDALNESVSKVKVSKELMQYGYSLFAGAPTTFAPATDIPVPPEYVLGPGDELAVQLYGSRDDSLALVVDREGVVELPPIGPLNVAGQSFVQVKALIAEKVYQNIIGATVSVSMGRLRSMRVFVLGDVNNPGSRYGPESRG